MTKCKGCSKADYSDMASMVESIFKSYSVDVDKDLVSAIEKGDMDDATSFVTDAVSGKGDADSGEYIKGLLSKRKFKEAEEEIDEMRRVDTAWKEIKAFLEHEEKKHSASWSWYESPN